MPDVLILAPRHAAVEVPAGETVPAEHVGIRGEHLPAHGGAQRLERSTPFVDRVDPHLRRTPFVVARDRASTRRQTGPLSVTHEVAPDDAVVSLAVDGDR